ncbi:MAG TPA: hypothetical protein VHZ51_18560 [Ktedonobacteraceae bacterium]|jgi:hypothetical protein|nr:hypothetical protein [Ktedonobacteraceae bacterium]
MQKARELQEHEQSPSALFSPASADMPIRKFDTSARALIPLSLSQDIPAIQAPAHTTPARSVKLRHKKRPPIRLSQRLRKMLIALAILAVIGVLVDGGLVVFTLLRVAHNSKAGIFSPVMILSSNVAERGDTITVHLSHCAPLSHLFLTRDIQEPIQIGNSSSPVSVDVNGNATVPIKITAAWKPGNHQIVAEDWQTHYTTSAPLYMSGPTPIIPPHLQVSQSALDMGSNLQWKNDAHPIVLSNTGSGSISWIASSDQPWLTFAPSQGIFSDEQQLFVAVSRAHLRPGEYEGTVTLISNASAPFTIHVTMTVVPLPAQHSAVLGSNPALLSFSTTDGNAGGAQTMTLSNPGSLPLAWSLESNVSADPVGQQVPFLTNVNWLSIKATSGVVAPAATSALPVMVHSDMLLAGVYTRILTFSAKNQALASPQTVIVTLTVSPHCGVVTNVGSLSFTALAGQPSPVTQNLGLSLAPGCPGPIAWKATSLMNWLALAPNDGVVQQNNHPVATVSVAVAKLTPGVYTGYLVFFTTQRTDMILVQLTVQPASLNASATQTRTASVGNVGSAGEAGTAGSATASLSASPRQLTFNVAQGSFATQNQTVAISNAGARPFSWLARVLSDNTSWLDITPVKGVLSANQIAQMGVSINSTTMQPGSYQAQVAIMPTTNTGTVIGSSQTITITLNVLPPCSLQVSPSKLAFSSSLLMPDPPGQSITLKDAGGCIYPISWVVSTNDGNQGWIQVSSSSGDDSGMGSTVTVNVNTKGMLLGTYNGSITISAFDRTGAPVSGNAQTIPITLTVLG